MICSDLIQEKLPETFLNHNEIIILSLTTYTLILYDAKVVEPLERTFTLTKNFRVI